MLLRKWHVPFPAQHPGMFNALMVTVCLCCAYIVRMGLNFHTLLPHLCIWFAFSVSGCIPIIQTAWHMPMEAFVTQLQSASIWSDNALSRRVGSMFANGAHVRRQLSAIDALLRLFYILPPPSDADAVTQHVNVWQRLGQCYVQCDAVFPPPPNSLSHLPSLSTPVYAFLMRRLRTPGLSLEVVCSPPMIGGLSLTNTADPQNTPPNPDQVILSNLIAQSLGRIVRSVRYLLGSVASAIDADGPALLAAYDDWLGLSIGQSRFRSESSALYVACHAEIKASIFSLDHRASESIPSDLNHGRVADGPWPPLDAVGVAHRQLLSGILGRGGGLRTSPADQACVLELARADVADAWLDAMTAVQLLQPACMATPSAAAPFANDFISLLQKFLLIEVAVSTATQAFNPALGSTATELCVSTPSNLQLSSLRMVALLEWAHAPVSAFALERVAPVPHPLSTGESAGSPQLTIPSSVLQERVLKGRHLSVFTETSQFATQLLLTWHAALEDIARQWHRVCAAPVDAAPSDVGHVYDAALVVPALPAKVYERTLHLTRFSTLAPLMPLVCMREDGARHFSMSTPVLTQRVTRALCACTPLFVWIEHHRYCWLNFKPVMRFTSPVTRLRDFYLCPPLWCLFLRLYCPIQCGPSVPLPLCQMVHRLCHRYRPNGLCGMPLLLAVGVIGCICGRCPNLVSALRCYFVPRSMRIG